MNEEESCEVGGYFSIFMGVFLTVGTIIAWLPQVLFPLSLII